LLRLWDCLPQRHSEIEAWRQQCEIKKWLWVLRMPSHRADRILMMLYDRLQDNLVKLVLRQLQDVARLSLILLLPVLHNLIILTDWGCQGRHLPYPYVLVLAATRNIPNISRSQLLTYGNWFHWIEMPQHTESIL
jgi:hypothetical protein